MRNIFVNLMVDLNIFYDHIFHKLGRGNFLIYSFCNYRLSNLLLKTIEDVLLLFRFLDWVLDFRSNLVNMIFMNHLSLFMGKS